MLETASDAKEGMPKAFAKNDRGLPEWVFNLRRTLYCKAKQEPTYEFYTLYSFIYREDVLKTAWSMVARNKGAPGVDGVSIEQIKDTAKGVETLLATIKGELIARSYKPSAVKRVYIPKANGKLRPLGIPTVKDRVVQAAVLLIIEPIFEADFMECSYGFRPCRSAHDALEKIREAICKGGRQAYDADMESYFDNIPHDKLIACVKNRITDGSIIKLIRMWLKTAVVEEMGKGKPPRYYKPRKGTPQGGVISPLLANLYLHFFDVMFHKDYGPGTWAKAVLVRYADDFVIIAKSVNNRIKSFATEALESRMGLKINREKTRIIDLKQKGDNLEFLGYVFRYEKTKLWKGWRHNMLPSKKSVKRIKGKISELTNSRNSFIPIDITISKINTITRGWANYFSLGHPVPAYRSVNLHIQVQLKQHLKRRSQRPYRRPENKTWYQHLKDLGVEQLTTQLRACES